MAQEALENLGGKAPLSAYPRRLNAEAPEFVPRLAALQHRRVIKIHQYPPHQLAPPPVIPAFHQLPVGNSGVVLSPMPNHGAFGYYGGGGRGEFGSTGVKILARELDSASPAREGISEEIVYKINKQVEYYFSDANLATTEHLMRFIRKDPEGFVPISVVASFRKIKTLVHNNALLAAALRKSSKLVVSDDGERVRRQKPFTESDVEELQARIIIAENLPEDHCYQNLLKVFSAVGNVKAIRTCYPQMPNGTTAAANRSSKLDMLFANKLHAFVEYETVEDAEKAVIELNDRKNWSGLRVRLLLRCLKHEPGCGRKAGHESNSAANEDDIATVNQPFESENSSQSSEALVEHLGEESLNDKEGGTRYGKGRGQGGWGMGRRQHRRTTDHDGDQTVDTPLSRHQVHAEQPALTKQLPGPRMSDGTKGFTMGRGKPLNPMQID